MLVFLEFNVDARAHRVDIQLFIDKNKGTSLFIITSNFYWNHFLASVLKVVFYVGNYWFKWLIF